MDIVCTSLDAELVYQVETVNEPAGACAILTRLMKPEMEEKSGMKTQRLAAASPR